MSQNSLTIGGFAVLNRREGIIHLEGADDAATMNERGGGPVGEVGQVHMSASLFTVPSDRVLAKPRLLSLGFDFG